MSEIYLNDVKALDEVNLLNMNSIDATKNPMIDISIDTRTIQPNQTYLAIRGERLDGHQYLQQAFEKKALMAVVDEKYISRAKSSYPLAVVPDTVKSLQEMAAKHRNKYDIPVIGLTGSNGKTTTKEMLAHLLSQRFKVHKNSGNFNNHIGCPLTLLSLNSSHQAAVVEMGTNHVGEIAVLGKIVQPDHALITNIGSAHLEFFGSKDAIFQEKRDVFEHTRKGGTIYINLDDPFLATYNKSDYKRVTYSMEHKADIQGRLKKMKDNGCSVFTINDQIEVELRVPGMHNISNSLAAVAVAIELGLSNEEIKIGLQSFNSYDKRMQIIEVNGIKYINDAYNSNPDSVKAVVSSVSKIDNPGKKIYALADMFELGDYTESAHHEIIRMALDEGPDILLLMGDHMKNAASDFEDDRIRIFDKHNEAAGFIKDVLNSGDLLLLKGSRGMTMEKILELLEIDNSLNVN
jgi:UDP-N-acetylmuramoyl-tripeptide--D-alanyl-D-alanine ligase